MGPRVIRQGVIYKDNGRIIKFLDVSSDGYFGFGEIYTSSIAPGSGSNWKCNLTCASNFLVATGEVVFFSRFNDCKSEEFLLSGGAGHRLFVPPACWYRFQCVSTAEAVVLNFLSSPYSECDFLYESNL